MTKEEAKQISEIFAAYAEGKTIQFYFDDSDEVDDCSGWSDITSLDRININNIKNYRIKPEQKLRPYKGVEEFLNAQKEHGMYLISKNKGDIARLPVIVEPKKISMFWQPDDLSLTGYMYSDLLNYWLHQDGTPCGIMEDQ